MRKILATLVACFFLLHAGGALASSYGACCGEECKAAHCVSMGCHTCASPVAAEAGPGHTLLMALTLPVPITAPIPVANPVHEVWRPPDGLDVKTHPRS